jgi:capsular exopolysaccharide synthesis family protein
MRLEHLRQQKDMKSVQVTSGGLHEGKTWLAMNLAVTFAQNSQSKVLLVDGDLHRPAVASRLGLPRLPGISRWWSGPDKDLSGYVYQVTGLSLWILPAGTAYEQPSNILRSVRFAEALFSLQGTFDWILVDSPPLLPFVDANLWSRLTDGMLLVVRENVTSLNALKKGLEAIDNLNVIGSVFNDARELEPHKRDDLAGR